MHYKHFHIVPLALVDAGYKFMTVDVDVGGGEGAGFVGAVLADTKLKQCLDGGSIEPPPPHPPLPGRDTTL